MMITIEHTAPRDFHGDGNPRIAPGLKKQIDLLAGRCVAGDLVELRFRGLVQGWQCDERADGVTHRFEVDVDESMEVI